MKTDDDIKIFCYNNKNKIKEEIKQEVFSLNIIRSGVKFDFGFFKIKNILIEGYLILFNKRLLL
jgi:hypothetical protein